MNPSPQENQPGEAAQDLVGPEPQAGGASSETAALIASITEYLSLGGLFNPEMMDHNAVRDLLINCRTQLAAERAKRLDLEGVLFDARQAIIREGLARDKAEAELLALRGGEVGETLYRRLPVGSDVERGDLVYQTIHLRPVGPEAKADGESRPTSAREWWIAFPEHEGFTNANCRVRSYSPHALDVHHKTVIHVREVTGEGRKVSGDCLEWLESMIMSTSVAPCVHAWCRELLCVLSEEGGRQKKGDAP